MIYIHIGQPKAYSTYYQALFYKMEQQHKCIYLGFRPDPDPANWYRSDIEHRLLDRAMRYDSNRTFREHYAEYQRFITQRLRDAKQCSVPLIVSSECLGINLLPGEVDVEVKLERLQKVFPDEASKLLICVFRNIGKSLNSLYKELVNLGYGQTFSYFLYEVWQNRDSGILDALLPYRIRQQLAFVRDENTQVQFVYTDNQPSKIPPIVDQLSKHKFHVGKDMAFTEKLACLNRQASFSCALSSMSELHRKHWHKNIAQEDDIWHKRRLIKGHIARIENTRPTEFDTSKLGTSDYAKCGIDWSRYSQQLSTYIRNEQKCTDINLSSASPWLTEAGDIDVLYKQLESCLTQDSETQPAIAISQ